MMDYVVLGAYLLGAWWSFLVMFRRMCEWAQTETPLTWREEGPNGTYVALAAAAAVVWPVGLPVVVVMFSAGPSRVASLLWDLVRRDEEAA